MLRDVETWLWFINNADGVHNEVVVQQHPFRDNIETHFVNDTLSMRMDDEYGDDRLMFSVSSVYMVKHLVMFNKTHIYLKRVCFKAFRRNGKLFSVRGVMNILRPDGTTFNVDKPRSIIHNGKIDREFAAKYLPKCFDTFEVSRASDLPDNNFLFLNYEEPRIELTDEQIEDMFMMRKLTFT
jgi:hypothetical protein